MAIDVAVMHAAAGDPRPLERFTHQLADDVRRRFSTGTPHRWTMHHVQPLRLRERDQYRPFDFLDEASLRLVEGPYDMVLVVTDAPLVGRRARAGVASRVARVVVVSVRGIWGEPAHEGPLPLDEPVFRWNALALVSKLVRRMLGERTAPWRYDASLEERHLEDVGRLPVLATGLPEHAIDSDSRLRRLWFHIQSAWMNRRETLRPLIASKAPLLPLSLPRLSTAAVAPSFVLMLSAEIWDVGVNLPTSTALWSALVVVIAASIHVVSSTGLLVPPGTRRRMTEHVAVVNVSIALAMLAAITGLLLMLWSLMLLIVVLVFPQDLIHTWPTLEDPHIGLDDMLRIPLFVATLGTITGAFAAGLESRDVLRELVLFDIEA